MTISHTHIYRNAPLTKAYIYRLLWGRVQEVWIEWVLLPSELSHFSLKQVALNMVVLLKSELNKIIKFDSEAAQNNYFVTEMAKQAKLASETQKEVRLPSVLDG